MLQKEQHLYQDEEIELTFNGKSPYRNASNYRKRKPIPTELFVL